MTVPPGGRKFEITEQASVWTNGYQGAAGAAPGGINFFPGTDPSVGGRQRRNLFIVNADGAIRSIQLLRLMEEHFNG